jgi:hypothetical protein
MLKSEIRNFENEVNQAKADRMTMRRKYADLKAPPNPIWSWSGPPPNDSDAEYRRDRVLRWEADHGADSGFKVTPELEALLTAER